MNKNNNFDELNKDFKQISKNLIKILNSLTEKLQSFEKNKIDIDEVVELIESYKNKLILEEE